MSPAAAVRLLVGAVLTAAAALAAVSGPTLGAWSASVAGPSWQAGTATFFTCADTVAPGLNDGANPLFALAFRSAAGPTDVSGNGRNGAYTAPATVLAAKAPGCPRDPEGVWRLNGTGDCAANTIAVGVLTPAAFSVEAWFRTSGTGASGTLVAFGATNRALYVDNGGKARGWIGGADTVVSTARVDDGQWHLATLVFTPSTGTALYVDGVLAGSVSSMSSATSLVSAGSWRVGCSATTPTWPSAGAQYLTGDLRFAAVYTSSLTKTQVEQHYRAGV
ncbi:hypothetical protein GCM10025783_21410 [Amnibacterium soli]|uniref:Signal peptidase I n=1 Tax=Amnibacterium soli TaxID=1282736 RepID=A0ABP8Z854_9MICO